MHPTVLAVPTFNRNLRLPIRTSETGWLVLFVLLLAALFSCPTRVLATTYTAINSGDWKVASNWSPAVVPGTNDTATISNGITITVTDTRSVSGLNLNVNSTSAAALTISNTASLTVSNGMVIPTGGGKAQNYNVNGTLTILGDITLNSGPSANRIASFTGSGTINCTNLIIGSSVTPLATHPVTLTNAVATLNLAGSLFLVACTNLASPGYVDLPTLDILSGAVNVSTGIVCNANGTAGLADTITMNDAGGSQSGTLNLLGSTPVSVGSPAIFTANFTGTGSTVVYSGSASKGVIKPATYNNLTINEPGNVNLNGASATVNGTLSLVRGALGSGAYSLILGSGATVVRGSGSLSNAPAAVGLVNLIYTNSVTTGPELPAGSVNLNKLTVTGTNVQVTLNAAAQVNGSLNFNYGTLGGTNPGLAALVTGANALTGPGGGGANVTINVSGTGFTNGSFPLIKTTQTGFTLGTLTGAGGSLNITGSEVDLNISAVGKSLVWRWTNGASGAWDIGGTSDWMDVNTGLPSTLR